MVWFISKAGLLDARQQSMDYFPLVTSGVLFTTCGFGIISGSLYFSVALSASLVTEVVSGAVISGLGIFLLCVGFKRRREEMEFTTSSEETRGRISPFYFEVQEIVPFYYELEPTSSRRALPPIPKEDRVLDLV